MATVAWRRTCRVREISNITTLLMVQGTDLRADLTGSEYLANIQYVLTCRRLVLSRVLV